MADYPNISLLSQLDTGTPADTEVANKLDDSIRQIKNFLAVFLARAHADNGALKDGAINNIAQFSDGIISTNELADFAVTAGKLALLAVGTAQLADDSVTAAKLKDDASTDANRAVTTDHIRDSAVTAAKLATDAVTETKILNDAVTADKLKDDVSTDANRAVTTNHIRDGAITNAKVGDTQIRGVKLNFNGGTDAAPKVMVGGTSGGTEVTFGGALTASIVAGVLTFALGGTHTSGASANYARVEEQKGNGVDMGGITAGDNTRGPWTEVLDPGDLVSVSGNTITIKTAGAYLIRASVPGYANGKHRCYLRRTSGVAANLAQGFGMVNTTNVQNRSELWHLIETSAANETFEIRHYSQNTVATNGMGLAVSSGETEVYSVVEIIRLADMSEV